MLPGDIVKVKPHIDFQVSNVIFTSPSVALIKRKLSGPDTKGYYEVLLDNGRLIFILEKQMEIISESR